MIKNLAFILLFLCVNTSYSFAEEAIANNENTKVESAKVANQPAQNETLPVEKAPQVGKHVMANMDASSMILSLLMVLGLIIISALVLKRFNLTQQGSNQLSVIASLSLGAKERVVVVQVGEQQLVLGVCSQQISLLEKLETPIDIQAGKSMALSGNVLSFLQTNTFKKRTDNTVDVDSNKATNETKK